MDIKMTPEEKKIALFKGYFISEFLRLEFAIENLIEAFFLNREDLPPTLLIGKPMHDLKSAQIKLKNTQIEMFFKFYLFADPFFSFKQKLCCMKAIMQLIDGDFCKTIEKDQYNIFRLMDILGQLRNIIAHNVGIPHEGEMMAIKIKQGGLLGHQFIENDKDGKKNVKNKFMFTPAISSFIITDKVKTRINYQIKAAQVFISLYMENNENLRSGYENVYSAKDYSLKMLSLTDNINKRDGVFSLFIKEDSKNEKKPKEAKD